MAIASIRLSQSDWGCRLTIHTFHTGSMRFCCLGDRNSEGRHRRHAARPAASAAGHRKVREECAFHLFSYRHVTTICSGDIRFQAIISGLAAVCIPRQHRTWRRHFLQAFLPGCSRGSRQPRNRRGTISGWVWLKAASTRSREVMVFSLVFNSCQERLLSRRDQGAGLFHNAGR